MNETKRNREETESRGELAEEKGEEEGERVRGRDGSRERVWEREGVCV